MQRIARTIKKIFSLRPALLDGPLTSSVERLLFAAFLFSVPFQSRVFLASFSPAAGEWGQAWLWLSDILFLLLFTLWLRRSRFSPTLFVPLGILLLTLPALLTHFDKLSLWSVVKFGEGLLLLAYARSHRHWILSSSRWLFAFLAALLVNAGAAIMQFSLQQDIGSALEIRGITKLLGESPLGAQAAGVAKFFVQGTPVIRGYGFTPHPNILAALLLVGVAIIAFLYVLRGVRRLPHYSWSRQKEEILRGVMLFLFLVGIMVTFSRSAAMVIALFPFLLAGIIFALSPLRRAFGWEAVRFLILFLVTVWLIISAFSPFLAARGFTTAYDQSIDLRLFYGEQAADMIAEHPWSGVGPGHFVDALVARNPDLPAWEAQPVHNVVLLLISELGIPAALLLIAGFVLLVISAWRRVVNAHDPGIALGSVCLLLVATIILLFSTTDHFLWTSQQGRILLWFTLGLLV